MTELQTQAGFPGFGIPTKAVRDGQAPVKQGRFELGTMGATPTPAPEDQPELPEAEADDLDAMDAYYEGVWDQHVNR